MARDFETLDIDELCSAQVECRADAESAKDLGFIGCAASGEVFPEDAGVLRDAAGWDDGILQRRATIGPGLAPGWIRSHAPGTTTNDDRVAAGDDPGVVVEGLVVPEEAIVIKGAVLALRISNGSGVGEPIA